MPYFIRARTYLRYAEEEFRRGHFEEAFWLAAKAIWALAQIEAPREKPEGERLLAELERAAEAEAVRFFREAARSFAEGVSPEEARKLSSSAIRWAREILAPILGPSFR
ncbi:hypothetical protein [Thermosulfurimonas sp. F29]|uniref:hypothetical protein n=1 Tax=Thermosulfurimonas sp. F29 TaxID=2867247 RepID=UPI001C83ADC8|nr:hypothetical protein [Thermosulfurimonas sp. F29]MBX6423935.1 hypothetical protein [Thermosulfurimonas sp. F29]